jgi:mannose-6-phosphate isomerase-like protein (cupin superfamily)
MDWHEWIKQALPRTEIMRGGATVWARDAQGLIGDTLGPILHLHDGASEIFYFPAGKCRLEVGDTNEYFEAGDFVLLPPGVPHNLWNAGDGDLLVFWIVAPHNRENKWRTQEIAPGDMLRRASRAHVEPGAALPSDANIHSRLLDIQSGERLSFETLPGQEAVLYIHSGQAQVQVGRLSGTLQANEFVHVPVGTAYSLEASNGAASVLLFEMPWMD